MLPKSYDFCPFCVFGVKTPGRVGRVGCRTCNTIVGEHYIVDGGDYWEHVQKCDYCDPPPGASDADIVERFHFWSIGPDEAPKKILVERTRAERRSNIESSEHFAAQLQQLWEEYNAENQDLD